MSHLHCHVHARKCPGRYLNIRLTISVVDMDGDTVADIRTYNCHCSLFQSISDIALIITVVVVMVVDILAGIWICYPRSYLVEFFFFF